MHDHHDHAAKAHELGLVEGTPAWAEWVKDYYRDIETYDWVDVADNLRGPEALVPSQPRPRGAPADREVRARRRCSMPGAGPG